MKKIKYIPYIFLLFAFTACTEDFLDRKDLYDRLDENFYSNPEQIAQALNAAYSKLTSDAGHQSFNLVASIKDDDRFGGGGSLDLIPHDADLFQNSNEDTWLELWRTQYEGIFRCNMIIKNFDKAVYEDEVERNRDLGETYFLRGFFYFRLAQMFGEVPLILDPTPVNLPKASADALYAQIASDLKTAIELLPDQPADADINDALGVRNGHTNKWVAQGIMARVFLFYTGYYEKSELPLAEGGSITQTQVLEWLENCISQSGYSLVRDPRILWPYTVVESYPYKVVVDGDTLTWVGDGNSEEMFAIKYSSFANWSPTSRTGYSNQAILYQGLRWAQGMPPFGDGWGFGPVNPQLWDAFESGDVRQQGYILNLRDNLPEEACVDTVYTLGGDPAWDALVNETEFWSKKGMPVVVWDGGNVRGYFYMQYGGNLSMQHWNMQDDPILRFADVLLMAAELESPNAQTYFDDIRERAGLGRGTKTVSLEAIKQERRVELCFEGLRYFDLLRWHDAEEAFAAATNIATYDGAVPTTYEVTFNPARAFLKIPESQIRLSNGQLVQNPGWE
jgi:starch-binding outer membrane protein, SusD/RagB family